MRRNGELANNLQINQRGGIRKERRLRVLAALSLMRGEVRIKVELRGLRNLVQKVKLAICNRILTHLPFREGLWSAVHRVLD